MSGLPRARHASPYRQAVRVSYYVRFEYEILLIMMMMMMVMILIIILKF